MLDFNKFIHSTSQKLQNLSNMISLRNHLLSLLHGRKALDKEKDRLIRKVIDNLENSILELSFTNFSEKVEFKFPNEFTFTSTEAPPVVQSAPVEPVLLKSPDTDTVTASEEVKDEEVKKPEEPAPAQKKSNKKPSFARVSDKS